MKSLSDYLYAKAAVNKIPLGATFELSPVCNFACKMCYVRKTPIQIQAEGKCLKHWTEWLELAKQFRDEGTLYLLLTGGEPFIYPDFRKLYVALHEMGFVISINSNGTMIDKDTVEWLKKAAPARINITLYGASPETYARICGNPSGYEKTVAAIKMLKGAGIPVVINASMIPENADDLGQIMQFGRDRGINTRVSTYMFPPVRRYQEKTDSRFTAEEASKMYLRKFHFYYEGEEWRNYLQNRLQELEEKENAQEQNWGEVEDEFMRCRAGRSSCWISWDGKMTACGMVSFPKVLYPFESSFKECWLELTSAVRTTPVLRGCQGCSKKELCKPCVAMIQAETGDVNAKAPYLCEMTDYLINNMKACLEAEED